MKRIYSIAMFAALALFSSCSTEVDNESNVDIAKSEISIGLPIAVSRTTINEEGEASWVDGDSFALWAESRTGAFNLNGAEFKMMYYWHSTQSAVFTSNTNSIADGTYTYYAVSPMPESVNGSKATYTIPAEQQGASFNGAYDIMVATPLNAEALSTEKVNNLALNFNHKMHALKMTIPEDGNHLPDAVAKVVFSFPTGVVGKVVVDATNATAAPTISETGKQLTVNIANGFDEGESAWATILPTNISGEVSYYAISTVGQRTLPRTFTMSKECLEGHITPLSLTIPEPIPPTIIRLPIGKNNLGEAVQTITVLDHNGVQIKKFATNSTNIYDLVEYGLAEEGLFRTYSGKVFTVRFESQHAIVERKVTLPTITKYVVNTLATTDVPYLFFEDFTSIHTSFAKDDYDGGDLRSADGMLLNDYMSVTGWNGAHIKGEAGKCVRVNVRQESTGGSTRSNGRLDTPAMKNLKEGAKVKLKIEFDMGTYIRSGYNKNNNVYCMAGTHTAAESSALNGKVTTKAFGSPENDSSRITSMFESLCLNTGYISPQYGENSFDSSFPTYTFTANECTSATRLLWIPCTDQSDWVSITNGHYYLYIDNIRVSITQ